MAPTSTPQGATPFASTRRRILVVENELIIRMMLSDELRDAGYDVIEAINADEALAVLQAVDRIDMMVSDVRMPGSLDGIGLLNVVRQARPNMPVIITSGHLQPTLATTEGATEFIAKPYRPEYIIEAVGAALANGP